jgi:arginine decarboxylase
LTARKKSEGTPYLDALMALRDQRDPTRLMVPGHKGGRGISPRLIEAFGANAEGILGLDIPLHVRDIDIGDDPTPIQRARRLAARAWGVHETHFVVGGASQSNHIVCLALTILARGRRPRVAVQRNVHQSVIYGLILADAEVVWLEPEIDTEFPVQHGVTPSLLEGVLDNDPLDAVMIVSPTYHGAVSDIQGLAGAIRDQPWGANTLFVVDEAWGAHFPFGDRFPQTAARLGADIVVSSTHKILGSLTQSAMLHVTEEAHERLGGLVEQTIDKARNLVKTTSPSALLMASLDAAREYAEGDGGELLVRAAENAERVRQAARTGELTGLRALDESIVERNGSVVAFDPLRVTLDVSDSGLSGRGVQAALWQKGKGGVEIEFCSDELIVLLFGIGDADPDSADSIVEALEKLLPPGEARPPSGSTPRVSSRYLLKRIGKPTTYNTLRDGYLGSTQTRALEDSENYVCAELVAPYPPGVAVVMPGELLTPDLVEYLLQIRPYAEFSDCRDPGLGNIEVLVGGGAVDVRAEDDPAQGKPGP